MDGALQFLTVASSSTISTSTSVTTTALASSSSAWIPEHRRRRRKIHKDVVIIGGGLAGLSAALYLSQIDPERHITILDKHDGDKKTSIATFAAAGMLAPQSERLPKGDYLDLCTESKQMFPGFADLVECMAQEAGEEGKEYLGNDDGDSGLEPWNIGYVASGGFLAPAFAGDSVATWAPPEDTKGTATWLDATQVRELEPNLNPNVVGGWWFPEDASVDARRLAKSLQAACVGAGVQIMSGANYEVSSLDLENGVCNGLWLKNGKYISTKTVLVANGAWMRNLLPVPIEAHKGQSLSLRMPRDRPPLLRRVLFGQDSYIVPKADGRIVIGATVEAGSFDPKVTPAGIMHILSYAMEIIPGLADLPLEETWAGLRPTTPDKGPILGETPWDNLFLAGGYWRNGVLLAPKTGELLATLIAGKPLSERDQHFLKAFAWDRFTSEEGGTAMAANARYAASMYPVHSRKSGVGVAASVGTELGSYSTAVSAREERKRDRETMFSGIDDSLDAFELAASMGKKDGTAFSFGDKSDALTSKVDTQQEDNDMILQQEDYGPTVEGDLQDGKDESARQFLEDEPLLLMDNPLTAEEEEEIAEEKEGPQADRRTQLGAEENARLKAFIAENLKAVEEAKTETEEAEEKAGMTPDEASSDLQSVYQYIRDNKSNQEVQLDGKDEDDRPDPGFRIFHIDESGTHHEVPPYTSPGEFMESIKNTKTDDSTVKEKRESPIIAEDNSEESFDGYTSILEAAANDDDIEKTMREARLKNRVSDDDKKDDLEMLDVDLPSYNNIQTMSDNVVETNETTNETSDLSAVYQQIRDQKAASSKVLSEVDPEEKPDPGFRIYHIDNKGVHHEVPPYTSPGEFMQSLQSQEYKPKAAPTRPKEETFLQSFQTSDDKHIADPLELINAKPASEKTRRVETVADETGTIQEANGVAPNYNEKTYDGYEAIIQANASTSREDELQAMREARQKNRLGQGESQFNL